MEARLLEAALELTKNTAPQPLAPVATQPIVARPRFAETSSATVTQVAAKEPAVSPVAVASDAPSSGESERAWPDENAEAVYLSEARDRGELPPPPGSRPNPKAPVGETDVKSPMPALPPLDELVQRLAPELRQTLEELFRAKFTSVRRIDEKFLKE